ncbi:hypothetical protein GQ600_20401 [Phytophthora cactorum]|nr:hypothetical protein GQ600_20401 [Phytophthora cactorum]
MEDSAGLCWHASTNASSVSDSDGSPADEEDSCSSRRESPLVHVSEVWLLMRVPLEVDLGLRWTRVLFYLRSDEVGLVQSTGVDDFGVIGAFQIPKIEF